MLARMESWWNQTLIKQGKDPLFEPLRELAAGNDSAMWSIAESMTRIQSLTLGLTDTFVLLTLMITPIMMLIPFLPSRMRGTAATKALAAD